MENGSKAAFPFEVECECDKTTMNVKGAGLSKREYFAGLAMQGICAGMDNGQIVQFRSCDAGGVAALSVLYADALLAELKKPQP